METNNHKVELRLIAIEKDLVSMDKKLDLDLHLTADIKSTLSETLKKLDLVTDVKEQSKLTKASYLLLELAEPNFKAIQSKQTVTIILLSIIVGLLFIAGSYLIRILGTWQVFH